MLTVLTTVYTVDYSSNFKYFVFNVIKQSNTKSILIFDDLKLCKWPLITKSGQVKLTKLKSDEPQGLELQRYLAKHHFQIYSALLNITELMIYLISMTTAVWQRQLRDFLEKRFCNPS